MAPESLAGESGVVEERFAGMRGVAGTAGAWGDDAGVVVVEVGGCEGVCDEGGDEDCERGKSVLLYIHESISTH